jgi:hypothetical protein
MQQHSASDADPSALPWPTSSHHRLCCSAVSHVAVAPSGTRAALTGTLVPLRRFSRCPQPAHVTRGAGLYAVCIARDASGCKSLYRYSLTPSQPCPAAAPIAGPAVAENGLPVCRTCQCAHVSSGVSWMLMRNCGGLLFATIDEKVYASDGRGCNSMLVASMAGKGMYTSPVLLRDGSAFLFSNGDGIWGVPLQQPAAAALSTACMLTAAAAAADYEHRLSPFFMIASCQIHRETVGKNIV